MLKWRHLLKLGVRITSQCLWVGIQSWQSCFFLVRILRVATLNLTSCSDFMPSQYGQYYFAVFWVTVGKFITFQATRMAFKVFLLLPNVKTGPFWPELYVRDNSIAVDVLIRQRVYCNCKYLCFYSRLTVQLTLLIFFSQSNQSLRPTWRCSMKTGPMSLCGRVDMRIISIFRPCLFSTYWGTTKWDNQAG